MLFGKDSILEVIDCFRLKRVENAKGASVEKPNLKSLAMLTVFKFSRGRA